MTLRISNERLNEILAYLDEYGEEKALSHFGINIETLHRYQRKKRYDETRKAKILLLDIETSTMQTRVWGLYKQRIPHQNVIYDWFMLGYAAKWLYGAEIMSDFVSPREAVNRDDKRVAQSVWDLMNDADIIIGHNIDRFDKRKINTRFILNGMKPPLPYVTIDTLTIAQKNFGFSSNRLDYLGRLMFDRGKLETNFGLWIKCEEGDKEAIQTMDDYCKNDVALLEEAYLELRPWIKSHPNVGLLMDAKERCCPNCGSFDIEETDRYYTTPANQYKVVRCRECGAPNRLPASVVSIEERKNLVRSIAR